MHLMIDVLWLALCGIAMRLAWIGRQRALRREASALEQQVGKDLLRLARVLRREWDERVAESGLLALLGLFAFASDSYPTLAELKLAGPYVGAASLFGVVIGLIVICFVRLRADDALDREG